MRLLFLTNFYPPASRGGYEMWCQEVAEGLLQAGHQVVVLTSSHSQTKLSKQDPIWVRRQLHLEMELVSLRNGLNFFTSRKNREAENLAILRQLVEGFDPQIILIWGMWNLPRSLAALAEEMRPGKVVYYLGDYWPMLPSQFEFYWQAPARNLFTSIPKFFLKMAAQRILAAEHCQDLQLDQVLFPTAFMQNEFKQKGITPKRTEIIYGAIDTAIYPYRNAAEKVCRSNEVSLLYVGRLTPDKGVHTAIEALAELVYQYKLTMLKLTIVGTGEEEYEAYLQRLILKKKAASIVTFLGLQPKEVMPSIYQKADILLFTSIWPEPFGRVIVEAMAAGVIVVGTDTGGASEILIDNENALLYIPGDATSLSTQLRRLIESPELQKKLSEAGRKQALAKFDLRRMTAEIEAFLNKVMAAN